MSTLSGLPDIGLPEEHEEEGGTEFEEDFVVDFHFPVSLTEYQAAVK